MQALRKKEKADFLARVTPIVGQAIADFTAKESWTDLELARDTEIPATRITEYKNFQKYGRGIAEKHLLILITRGIVKAEDLLKKAENQREREFIEAMASVESDRLRLKILKVQRAGIDLEKMLDEILAAKEQE